LFILCTGHTESGCQVLTPAALRDIEWFTYTCPFGFPVMGKLNKEEEHGIIMSYS